MTDEIKTAVADVTKAASTVSADAEAAKTAVVSADATLTTWIKSNAGKIAIAVLAAAVLVVWKIL